MYWRFTVAFAASMVIGPAASHIVFPFGSITLVVIPFATLTDSVSFAATLKGKINLCGETTLAALVAVTSRVCMLLVATEPDSSCALHMCRFD
jgi:hypothetical protein